MFSRKSRVRLRISHWGSRKKTEQHHLLVLTLLVSVIN
ncbi:MAG: hypothetical protein OFPI_29910 [Osedax symbiont Rs2]|nr:MAG: hypothetical protein OFPI_29910 [Osedax symbiont Rs2]